MSAESSEITGGDWKWRVFQKNSAATTIYDVANGNKPNNIKTYTDFILQLTIVSFYCFYN